MKRLHLLRHAKSSWDDPGLSDHARPLAARGRKAATRMARRLETLGVRPGLVLCSSAARAQETLALLASALRGPPLLFEDELYHASAATLLERLRAVSDDVDELLLVGHNPGLADLCLLLARPDTSRHRDLRDRVAVNLPTGALATLETDGDGWAELAPGGARLVELLLPRELEGQGKR